MEITGKDVYSVIEVIKTAQNGWTEKVQSPSGEFYIRKFISKSIGMPGEYDILDRLDNPALPKVYERYEQDGYYVVIMEYIKGATLRETVESLGRISPDNALYIAEGLCCGVSYLHSQNPPIIHHDIKPDNIIIDNGSVRLIDLGIAEVFKPENDMGTVGYAPPEQFGFSQTDTRADIYSIGMTIKYMLTGADPGSGGEKSFMSHVPNAINDIINRCADFSSENRYSHISQLIQDIEEQRKKLGNYRYRSKKQALLRWLIPICVVGLILLLRRLS